MRSDIFKTAIAATACAICLTPVTVQAQDQSATPTPAASAAITTTMDAAESDGDFGKRELVSWNHYEGPYFSLRMGAGFLWDTATYSQDDTSERQLAISPKNDLRDFRLIAKGQIKFIPGLSYTVGYMYDKAREGWSFRQTGLMYEIPALNGSIFVGRTKEGFSTSKIMVGYQGWTNERAAINDALIPILADGVKWSGYSSSGKFVYSVGVFGDVLSENESFNRNDNQFTARGVWLPWADNPEGDLLHLALEARYVTSDDGFLQYRSKPESFEAQAYAIDSGKFPAQGATTIGLEGYYVHGPLVVGSEYFLNQVHSRERDDPFFHGGEIFVAYTLTGERRPYNARGAYFEKISPDNPVFEGGFGAWEAVLRFSYADLDSQSIYGGTFWRITPGINWHMSDNVRLEFFSGYGVLEKLGQSGGLTFFQTRLQLQL